MRFRRQMSDVRGQIRGGHSLRVLTFAFCMLFGLMVALPARAQTVLPEDQMYQIAKQLNCPTCAGRNLADCPTDTCTQWKQEIVSQLKAGKSGDEVLAYFRARFGDQVLQEPPKEGFTLLMWVVPVLAAAVLIVVAVLAARRAASRNSGSTKPATSIASTQISQTAPANSYESQLEQQVKDAS